MVNKDEMSKSRSRKQYERENPVVSVRLTKSLKEALDGFKGEHSYAEAFKVLAKFASSTLLFLNPKNKVTFPCSICGEEIQIVPNSKAHEFMRRCMKENGWAHSECIQAEKG